MNHLLRPRNWEPACGTERLVPPKFQRRRKRSERELYGRPSWRPRVLAPATYRSGTETNPAVPRDELPGGTPIFTVSRQQFMKYPG
jgi:hypothetical protein